MQNTDFFEENEYFNWDGKRIRNLFFFLKDTKLMQGATTYVGR